jgi:branched-chain amino acid aminotransferase
MVGWKQATIHVMSHVVHYGSSVFEGIRCYATPEGPAIFRLREHIRRLEQSCRIYRIPLRHSAAALERACAETVRANELTDCYLRPIVARTGEQMGVLPDQESVETFIIAWRWGAYLGPSALAEGVDVCVASWRRPAANTHPAMAKAGGNYLNAQLALGEARLDGYAEAILLDTAGYVSEGSGENLFLVRDGVLFTPPPRGRHTSGHHPGHRDHDRPGPGLRSSRAAHCAGGPVRGR